MTSDRKREANQRNAEGSTGPKNTKRSRYNARKHGLLSKAALIEHGDAKENPRELKSLFDDFWEDYQPVGKVQKHLVDEIVTCVWLERRALRAEVGEIRRGADSVLMQTMGDIADRYYSALQQDEMSPSLGSEHELTKTTFGIAHMKSVLEFKRVIVEEQGTLTKDQLAEVIEIYGHREGSFAAILWNAASMATRDLQAKDDEEPDTRRDIPSPAGGKEFLLHFIGAEIARLKGKAVMVAAMESLEPSAALLSRHLPSNEFLEKSQRYQTAISRRKYRAMKEIRELQASGRARSTRLGAADNGM